MITIWPAPIMPRLWTIGKDALIIDVRNNSGGNIDSIIISMLTFSGLILTFADIVIELADRPERPVVLIERKFPPLGWALPGGFVDVGAVAPDSVGLDSANHRDARAITSAAVEMRSAGSFAIMSAIKSTNSSLSLLFRRRGSSG